MAAVDLQRRAVRVASSARHAVQSYESRPKQRKAERDSKRLSAEEHGDLLLLWGGYDAAIGCRSAFGAILDAALRAPPRERPIWRLVTAELDRRGGRMPLDKLVTILADEGMATAHEVRRALRAMQGIGRITKSVQDEPERVTRIDPATGEYVSFTVVIPTEVVRLERVPGAPPPPELTREERWRREDEEVRALCEGVVPCHETRSCRRDSGLPAGGGGSPPANDVRLPFGLDRCVLERVYGTSHHPPYRDVFGGAEAAVVEYTEAAAEERARLGVPSVAEAIRLVLDGAPADAVGAERWRQDRDRFIARARAQAGKLIDRACEAFRAAKAS